MQSTYRLPRNEAGILACEEGDDRGDIFGLIGPNGAGKTTCFNAITGVYEPAAGSVTFDGRPLKRVKRHEITRRGIARTFQNVRLFGEMTALENVVVGTTARYLLA